MALGELRHGASARRVTLNSRVDPGQKRAGARGEPHAGPTGRNPARGRSWNPRRVRRWRLHLALVRAPLYMSVEHATSQPSCEAHVPGRKG